MIWGGLGSQKWKWCLKTTGLVAFLSLCRRRSNPTAGASTCHQHSVCGVCVCVWAYVWSKMKVKMETRDLTTTQNLKIVYCFLLFLTHSLPSFLLFFHRFCLCLISILYPFCLLFILWFLIYLSTLRIDYSCTHILKVKKTQRCKLQKGRSWGDWLESRSPPLGPSQVLMRHTSVSQYMNLLWCSIHIDTDILASLQYQSHLLELIIVTPLPAAGTK